MTEKATPAVSGQAGTDGRHAFTWSRQWNIPNQITLSRLVLACGCLVLIQWQWWLAACITFLVAASTDFIDGYIARKYGMVTVLGRILDPLVDKIVVGGALTFLAAVPDANVSPWVAVIVIGRELFITSLRSVLEAAGSDFSAVWSGKVKMVLQSAAVVAVLLNLYVQKNSDWKEFESLLHWASELLIWSAIAATLYSGYVYVARAAGMFRSDTGR